MDLTFMQSKDSEIMQTSHRKAQQGIYKVPHHSGNLVSLSATLHTFQ